MQAIVSIASGTGNARAATMARTAMTNTAMTVAISTTSSMQGAAFHSALARATFSPL